MEQKVKTGRRGEEMALEWLRERGLWLRERNWRWEHKEIDLIMESEKWLHVVEVKLLRKPSAIEPWEQVGREKQRNLAVAADHYVRLKGIVKEVHFDIVSIVEEGERARIEYIPEAFHPIG